MDLDKNLVKGSMVLLVMKLLETEDMYGYQMISELERRSDDTFHLKAGTLYPILHTLEQDGCVHSYEQESAAGKPRRYYHLTEQGHRMLSEKVSGWEVYSQSMSKVLKGGDLLGTV